MQVFTERRIANDGLSTISEVLVDGKRVCFSLEPGPRSPLHPRKPGGRYELVLRKAGGIYQNYRARFPTVGFFVGIPQILVPGRTFIEIHIGNRFTDTEGCSLTGQNFEAPAVTGAHFEVRQSETAYLKLYPLIRDACVAGPVSWVTLDEGVDAIADAMAPVGIPQRRAV